MGLAAAAESARALLQAGAGALVSWGMAGGLDPALAPGTIFLPTEVLAPTGAALASASPWRERVAVALAARAAPKLNSVVTGRLLTSPTAIGSQAEKARMFRETGAAAVDMESLAVAEVARAQQKPFLAVRVIVDGAADSLPRAVTAAANDQGHLHVWRLIGALAREPTELGPLIRLACRYRAASRSLAEVARLGSLAPYAFTGTVDGR
jgi:adenosylhomocysteine nucleosidase